MNEQERREDIEKFRKVHTQLEDDSSSHEGIVRRIIRGAGKTVTIVGAGMLMVDALAGWLQGADELSTMGVEGGTALAVGGAVWAATEVIEDTKHAILATTAVGSAAVVATGVQVANEHVETFGEAGLVVAGCAVALGGLATVANKVHERLATK